MTKAEIEAVLRDLLDRELEVLEPPSVTDWRTLEDKFGCTFCDDFRFFIELMAVYVFPGDILNVSSEKNNGNDSIVFTYDYELEQGGWEVGLIPFYNIGNGDYFCMKAQESPDSPVYYFYHEDQRVEQYSKNFEGWIKTLPDFLT